MASAGRMGVVVGDSRDVLNEVRKKYDELTHSQKRIAEAIVEDPEFVAFATVDKLAERLSVAPSTVVRFTYKLGLGGYPDLQERIREIIRGQIRSGSGTTPTDEAVGAHLADSGAGASLRHDLDNVRQTIAVLDDQLMCKAIELLTSARNIFVIGGFASSALSSYMALTLERIRGQAYLVESLGGRHVPALFEADASDVAIVIGFAPYSSTSVQLLEVLSERRVSTIGLTDTPISPVGQRVDIALQSRVSGMVAQNSLVAPMAVINALLNGVMAAKPDAMSRYEQLMSSMNRWDLFVLSDDHGEGDAGSR